MYVNEVAQKAYYKDMGLPLDMPGRILERDDRSGDWMQGYQGTAFWPMDPHIEDIDLETVAHALSLQCRFGGHVKSFYSVAEHCYRASFFHPEAYAFEKLMHDASEAYLQDVPRPIKRGMEMEFYNTTEDKWHKVLSEKFGFTYPYPPEVKLADEVMLHWEARDLMKFGPWHKVIDWKFLETFPETKAVITPMPPLEAKIAWLNRFHYLEWR